MANPEHIDLVMKGKEALALWKIQNPNQRLDLTDANLSSTNLIDAVFMDADLMRANLAGANLRGALFHNADLTQAILTNAKLFQAEFAGAILCKANLDESDLTQANFLTSNLIGATLRGSTLLMASFQGANLNKSDMTKTDFNAVLLQDTELEGTILTDSSFDHCSISGCDISTCVGLTTINHKGPSSIALDTLISTFRNSSNQWTPDLMTFFLGTGIPQEILEGLPKIIGEVKHHSCFIAYGEPDKVFAERLHQEFGDRGISRWVYSMDSTPGERTWQEIIKNRREADKFIVLCSAQGLIRDGVLKEIEEQMDEDQEKIIPVSLDDVWKQPGFRVMRGSRDLKPFLLERNYADFGEGTDYEQQLQRLLRGLERKNA